MGEFQCHWRRLAAQKELLNAVQTKRSLVQCTEKSSNPPDRSTSSSDLHVFDDFWGGANRIGTRLLLLLAPRARYQLTYELLRGRLFKVMPSPLHFLSFCLPTCVPSYLLLQVTQTTASLASCKRTCTDACRPDATLKHHSCSYGKRNRTNTNVAIWRLDQQHVRRGLQ